MPHLLNGIGTWYLGKRNLETRTDTCGKCGRTATLSSYDTRLWFLVIFVPVIPLGRKHVLDECSRCRRHAVVPLARWQAEKTARIGEALAHFAEAPSTAEAAAGAIHACAAFRDGGSLGQVAPAIAQHHAHDPAVLGLLAAAWDQLGHHAEAADTYLAALAAGEEPGLRADAIRALVMAQRPLDAAQLLRPLLQPDAQPPLAHLLAVTDGLQAQGLHREAMDLIDEACAAVPALQQDKVVRKARARSEKHAATGKRLAPQGLAAYSARSGGGGTGRWAWIAVPVLAVVAVAAWLFGTIDAAKHRQVHLVTGLAHGYQVEVNGTRYRVRPDKAAVATVAEGDVAVRAVDDSLALEPIDFRIETPFWSRAFVDGPLRVANLDRCALMIVSPVIYQSAGAARPLANPSPPRLRPRQAYQEIAKIDYAFREAPDTISVEASRPSRIRRQQLTLVSGAAGQVPLGVLLSLEGPKAATEWCRERVRHETNDAICWPALSALLDPDEAEALLGEALAARPVVVEAHRAWQDMEAVRHPERDLAADYRALLAEAPDDPDRLYLAGRTLSRTGEAQPLYERAANATPPSIHARLALAMHELSTGHFPEAREWTRAARKADCPGWRLDPVEAEVLVATRATDEIGQRLAAARKLSPEDLDAALEALDLLWLQGEGDAVDARAAEITKATARLDLGGRERKLWAAALEAEAGYLHDRGDAWGPVADFEEAPAEMRLAALVARGDLDGAAGLLEDDDADGHLTVALAAHVAGRKDLEAAEREKAVAALAEGGKSDRLAAEVLGGRAERVPELLEDFSWPASKRLRLAAAGLVHARHRQECFALARTLNYEPGPPRLLLASVVGGGATDR